MNLILHWNYLEKSKLHLNYDISVQGMTRH